MADVVGSPVAGLTSAESAGDETEQSLLSAASAREVCSDGDATGPAGASGKATDHAEVMAVVKKQVEFYFSDANLPTDKHLLKQIQKDAEGYVPLRMIANFKRVKALTKDLGLVAEALRGSTVLSLDSEGSRVRRAAPLPTFDVQDITRRTVVVEHLPDRPTIESVTQLLAQHGKVVMVRICSRGNTSKLPAWLAKAVDAINVTMAPGEFALVEFGSEDDCMACVTKTKNPDNWRTSLRVRHLQTNFKPSTKASSSTTGSRPRSSLDFSSRHEAEAAGHQSKSHGREREHSGTGDGSRLASSRRSSHDGSKCPSHDGHSQQQQHREERGRQDAGSSSSGSAAAAVAAADLPVHLSPIRTHAADSATQQQQRSASPYANGAARMNGASSPSPMLSPVKTGTSTSGVGGSIGSPRTVRSPAPAAVTSFIDSILSAPTASTPTREGRSSAGGGVEGRWGSDWGAGSSGGAGSMTPAAAVAAALAGVSTPPQSGSPRHSANGGGAGSSRASQSGGFCAGAAAPSTPTRLSVASGSGSSHTPLAVQQGALAAQLAAAAAAAAQAAMAGSPRAVQGSSAANWRSASAAGASISAPTTPLAGLSAGDAVAEALESLGLGGCSSSSRGIPVGSPDLSSSPKPAPWVPASRLQHMQQAAAHGDARNAMRSSGSEAEENTAGTWRASWTGQAGSPLNGTHMRPPKHRTSGSGSASQSGGKQRRRSWHATEAEADAAARGSSSGGIVGEGNSSDGSAGRAATGNASSCGRRSRLAQQGGDTKSSVCAIREARGELEALVAAAEAGSGRGIQQRRRSSNTGHDADNAGAASSSRDAGEEQDDEHEDGEHEHGKRRRRRHRGSGSRRASLDEPHPSAGGSGSRRQSLDEGSRGGSRRQSLDEPGPRQGSRPGSRASALSPSPEEALGGHSAHSRPNTSCSGGGGKAHSHHSSPSPASHMSGEHRSSHDGSVAKEGSKKKEKKDYASWAAATPEFRAAAAAAQHSGGGGNANSSGSSGSALGSSPARAGLSPLRASGGGAASGHDGDSHVRIARMPDGTRGFGMGRGRALTPAPQ